MELVTGDHPGWDRPLVDSTKTGVVSQFATIAIRLHITYRGSEQRCCKQPLGSLLTPSGKTGVKVFGQSYFIVVETPTKHSVLRDNDL